MLGVSAAPPPELDVPRPTPPEMHHRAPRPTMVSAGVHYSTVSEVPLLFKGSSTAIDVLGPRYGRLVVRV